MEIITKYKAEDGIEFNSATECAAYELLIERVNLIMNRLPSVPKGCDFSNGGGFVQHDASTLKSVKTELLELIKAKIDHDWIQQTIDDESSHPSFVSRLLEDYNIKPLNSGWYRFECIDSQSREWGQPYFASNPNEATQIQLN